MSSPHDAGPRRGRALLVACALAVAFVIAAWDRLGQPFWVDEASFLHDSLHEAGQVVSPRFGHPATPELIGTLGVVRQLSGTSERPLRIALLALIAAAGLFAMEAAASRRLSAAVTPLLALLALPTVASADVVHPFALLLLPAALMTLAAARERSTAGDALALAGGLAVGALDAHAAILLSIVVLAGSALAGPFRDRLMGALVAAIALTTAWVVHGPGAPARLGFALPDLTGAWTSVARTPALAPWLTMSLVLGLPALASFAALLVRDESWRHRVATLLGCSVAIAAGACVTVGGERVPPHAILALLPPVLALAAASLDALGSFASGGVALLLAWLAAAGVTATAPVSPSPAQVLEEVRAAAAPGAALVVSGPERIRVAVYARLGHSVPMHVIYLPEDAAPDGLADLARRFGIRRIWLYPPRPEAPRGFSAPDTRPAQAPHLMPLVLEDA